VPDLPEDEVIKLLHSAQIDGQPSNTNDIQVGETRSNTPTLPFVLASCVSYPTSDAALSIAIREQLKYAEAIIPILTILDDWLVKLSSHGTSLILNANVGESGPPVEVPTRPYSGEVEIPPFDKVSSGLSPNTSVDRVYKRYWHFYGQFSMQHS